jgi:2-oxoacid:acceptor oxidoreductase gamma subunit (pyruvate/2-ketoisovalerate family)
VTFGATDAQRWVGNGEVGAVDVHEVRLVGRGGQGVVTAGDLLGQAALHEGRWAQSIPTFGPERRGALSTATLRIGDDEILLKCAASRPEVVLVLDPTIWHYANVLGGIREGAVLLFNTPQRPEEIEAELADGRYGYRPPVARTRLFTVDATGIALEALGRPITNTAMMGAFAGATGLVEMESLEIVLTERFGRAAAANVQAARAACAGLAERGA